MKEEMAKKVTARQAQEEVNKFADFIPVIGWSDDCLALAGALAFAKMDLEEYKAWKFGSKAGGQKLLKG